ALDQRNSLLKAAQETFVSDDEFDVWEDRLAESGDVMRTYRLSWLATIEAHAMLAQERLGRGEKVSLRWAMTEPDDARRALTQNRRRDISRGSTTTG
ncbi:hypothetical protein ABTM42_19635, partial [Acinetobacter baumannii]